MKSFASEALLFLERVPQPIWVGDETGDVIYSNEASLALIGYTREEYWGRSGHELTHYMHPDGTPYPVSECQMLTPRLTGETIHCDLDWFIRRDGSFYPISWWAAPIELPTGRGVVVSFTDMTEHRELELAARERDAAEIRAQVSRASGRRIVGASRRRESRHGAEPPRRCATATRHPVDRPAVRPQRTSGRLRRMRARVSTARSPRRAPPSTSSVSSLRASTRRSSPLVGSWPRSPRSRSAARSRSA